jgi:TolB-like protein
VRVASDRATIFLSYAHADAARAQKLAAALAASGYDIWWDALIEGGAQFSKRIREALDRADVVMVLWSATSIDSDWVCDEAAQGRDRHRLVPITLDGSTPPLGFRQYQTIDLSRWRGRARASEYQAVLRAVEAATASEMGPAQPQAFAGATPGVDRRRAMAIGGGATVVAAAGIGAWQAGLIGGGSRDDNSIAVLNFKNLTGDAGQEYLSAGLSEQVRGALSRIPALKVLAATSSQAAASEDSNATGIARKLKVAWLLDGSIQRAGTRIRVGVNLTDGKTGFSTWSQSLDRPMGDMFAVQSEIARLVAGAMSVRLATSEPAPGGTSNVRAYEEYLKGRALYLAAKDEASDRAALSHYEVALVADPNFALAHAALARVLASIAANNADASELKPLYARAIAEARRAIEIEPNLAEGQLALGYIHFAGQLDIKAARPAYEKAAKLGAGDADILLLYALFQVRSRRFGEAREAIGRALVLDPLNPRTWRAAGAIELAARQPGEALARFDKALSLNPKMSTANASKAYALIHLKRYGEAKAVLDKEPNAMFRLTGQAITADKADDRKLAEASMAELVSEIGDAGLYQQAQVLAQWGRTDDALDRLERAKAVGDSGLISLTTDPFLDPIAKEPRYRALVQAMGLA